MKCQNKQQNNENRIKKIEILKNNYTIQPKLKEHSKWGNALESNNMIDLKLTSRLA